MVYFMLYKYKSKILKMQFTHSKNIYRDKSDNRCKIFITSLLINLELKGQWLTATHSSKKL